MEIRSIGRQGLWYLLAGALAAAIELGLFQFLYAVIELNVAWSNVMATVTATILNFIVNRNITFQSTSNPFRSAILYFVLFLVNMSVSTIVINLLVGMQCNSVLAKAIMQICVMSWNFILYRKIIFI